MEHSQTTLKGGDSDAPLDRLTLEGGYLAVVFAEGGAATVLRLDRGAHILGRHTGPDGGFADSRVSKRHVEIALLDPVAKLRDLGSRNGTFLNGHHLPPSSVAPLCDGDVLRVGNTVAVFRRGPPPDGDSDDRWLPGRAPGVLRARAWLRRVAPLDTPVLILGETGTGKEWVAQGLHKLSACRAGPFVPVNCAELEKGLGRAELFGHERGAFTDARIASPGLVGAAEGGLLFFDEIGDLAGGVQAELLRFLEDRTYRGVGGRAIQRSTARFVAATHVDLDLAVRAGAFRGDLLARMRAGGQPIVLPSLRERPEDIVEWAIRFGGGPQLTAGFVEALMLHSWPENLRGLRGAVATAVLGSGGDALTTDHLPPAVLAARTLARQTEAAVLPTASVQMGNPEPGPEPDREAVAQALTSCGGVMKQAAKELGMERTKLYRLCEQYGLEVEAFRRGGVNP